MDRPCPKRFRAAGTALILLLTGSIVFATAGLPLAAGPTDQTDATELPVEEAFDDLLDQFDDDEAPLGDDLMENRPSEPAATESNRRWRLGGELSLSAATNFAHDPPAPGQTDWRGLSRMRSLLALEVDAQPMHGLKIHASGYGFYDFAYSINGRDEYTDQVLDAYEIDLELTETYALVNPVASLDFRFGRQIVVWGGSDNIRVTDVLNPLDRREPGLTDLEYIRLPVTMSRLDYYLDRWRFSGMAIHEIRFDKNPPFGSDYFPFPTPLPPEEIPSSGLDNTEWALSASGTFSGWDLALYAADHFDDRAYLEAVPGPESPTVVRRHADLRMLGAAINVAIGNWLFKSEAAWQDGFRYAGAPHETFSHTDILMGFEYSGFAETTIAVEMANRHINGFREVLREPPDNEQPDRFQTAVRVVREFMNDRLTGTLLAMLYGPVGEDGAFQRLQAEYDLRDNLEITAGVVFYQSGNLPAFREIGDNDRVFVEVAYHF